MSAPERVQAFRAGFVVAVAIAFAGCGSGPSQTPVVSPTPAPTALATREPTPSASPSASPSVAASEPVKPSGASGQLCTTGGSTAIGRPLSIKNADLRLSLPDGWIELDLELYRQLLTAAVASVDDPRLTKSVAWQSQLIADGIIRAVAAGTSEPSGAQAVLLMSVLSIEGDLEATVDARLADEAANGIPAEFSEFTESPLPAGPAFCIGTLSAFDVGVPSQTIEYVVHPVGDFAISIAGTAPDVDNGFPDIVRSVALSLATD
jgi:hypothetical protein